MGKTKLTKSYTPKHRGSRLKAIVASNIKKARLGKNWQQKQLAAAVKVTQASISNIESGSRSPSLEMIEKIARALEINPASLLMSPELI